jgi:predicted dehydrogenase
MKKIRFGIISTAKIGQSEIIPAMRQSQLCEVTAISSRSKSSAQKVADELGIAKTYGSTEELLADPDIDAVYNPLPNHLHVPVTIQAMEAGKHVLCEKPISMDAQEAELLLEKSKECPTLRVMEAFVYRFHPQWQKVKDLVKEGEIGDLKTITSHFFYYNDDENNIRNFPEMGGGGLMDIGCYCISMSRFIFESEPKHLKAFMRFDPEFGVDRLTHGIMEFEKGTSSFSCGTQQSNRQEAVIAGDKGHIVLPSPFNPGSGADAEIHLFKQKKKEIIEIAESNQYSLMCDAFARSILDDTEVPTPLEDAVANMMVIDAVRETAS